MLSPVAFTLQPQPEFVLPGTNVTLSADAAGNGALRYQWRFEGTNILNAINDASHSFTNASLLHHGTYSVLVTDDVSTAVSSNAFIFVRILPGIWNNFTSIAAQSLMQTVQVTVPKPPLEPARCYRVVTPRVP